MAFAPLLMEGLTPEMEKIAKKELGETPLVKKESLEKIKRLIEKEPDFYPCMDDKFLLMFLRNKKHNIQRAFKALRNYYIFKEKYSGVYTDFLPSGVKNVMDANCYSMMPLRDAGGRLVIIIRPGQCLDKGVTIENIFSAILIVGTLAYRMEASSVCGCVTIIDLKGFSAQQFYSLVSPKFIIFIFNCIQDCLPYRMREIHIVNESAFFNVFYNIIKFAIPKKLRDRFHMHGKNIEALHKHFSPEILPEELGGKAGPVDSTVFYNNALRLESFAKEMIECGFRRTRSVNSG
ncbi:alpha-tocopherol transfer protein-like [Stegodyphus dumicola]|uniref:alpha-tocopherol transfer protein-like n=1 Tax=Stegodyphus dumicola TaxID=202533 RepID=UPI0015B0B145|nr:alpha-tocopherol transfer protein-like [Stegodyphus dumicola]